MDKLYDKSYPNSFTLDKVIKGLKVSRDVVPVGLDNLDCDRKLLIPFSIPREVYEITPNTPMLFNNALIRAFDEAIPEFIDYYLLGSNVKTDEEVVKFGYKQVLYFPSGYIYKVYSDTPFQVEFLYDEEKTFVSLETYDEEVDEYVSYLHMCGEINIANGSNIKIQKGFQKV